MRHHHSIGTRVQGSITVPIFARVFMAIWFGVGLATCVVTLVSAVPGTRDPAPIIPFAILAFVGLIFIGGFELDARKTLRDLALVFGAAIE